MKDYLKMEFDLSFHLFCVLSDDSSMFYLVSDHIFSSLVYQYTHHRTLSNSKMELP
jgi:CRISPR/Cas system CSM-associated protein Csm4 (group 5 of RAMP superfamily)